MNGEVKIDEINNTNDGNKRMRFVPLPAPIDILSLNKRIQVEAGSDIRGHI